VPKQVHIGEVTNNEFGPDAAPLVRGEVMFKCETLLSDGSEYPVPAMPSFPLADPEGFGLFWVPEVGATIEVEIEDGIDYLLEEVVKYKCALYSDVNDIPEEFQINYPKRKGFKFKSGILMFDDTDGEMLVNLLHSMGHGIEMTKDGDLLQHAIRDMVVDIVRDLVMEALQKVIIKGVVQANLESDTLVVLDAPLIQLTAGAVEPMVLGTQLLAFLTSQKAWNDGHGHSGVTTGPGASGPPVAPSPAPPSTINSTKITGS
jgi:hypothetical protein